MRAIDFALLLLIVAVGSYGCLRLVKAAYFSGKQRSMLSEARWEPYHSSQNGRTEIGVRLLIGFSHSQPTYEGHRLADIDDADPEYDRKFLDSMWEAKQRAATLQLESPTSP